MSMSLGKGHQASSGTAYGTTKMVNGQVSVVNVKTYPEQRCNRPKARRAWIGSKPA